MEYTKFVKVSRGDRIDNIMLTPEEEAGAREVIEQALPKCQGWPQYQENLGKAALGGAQVYELAQHSGRLSSEAENADMHRVAVDQVNVA